MRHLFLLLVWILSANITLAADNVEVVNDHSTTTLASEHEVIKSGSSYWIALTFKPIDEWHTYWSNPGDSGMKPILNWTLPDNINISEPFYETPELIPAGPLMNYGYHHSNSMLFKLDVPTDYQQSELVISLDAEWLVCKEACIPEYGSFSITVPVGEQANLNNKTVSLFTNARNSMPMASYWDSQLTIGKTDSSLQIYMDATESEIIKQAYYFPEGEGVLNYAEKQILTITLDGLKLSFKKDSGAPKTTNPRGILKLLDINNNVQSYELTSEIKFLDVVPEMVKGTPLPIWQAMFFALVGGLILNLMPCVFPVLSLKAFAFISSSSRSSHENKVEGWAYTAGILASFFVIVIVLIFLKSTGEAIGWGFQLQEPRFIATMIIFLLLISLSLLGIFHLSVGSLESSGDGLTKRKGASGAFFTGVLATLVATPCTAPLMAPAIGFALTQSAMVIFLVFMMLGIGLALPFLLLSHSSRLAAAMPRPGPWMDKTKNGLAFPMMLTAVWLLYVYVQQTNVAFLFILIVCLLFVSFFIWLRDQTSKQWLRHITLILAFIVAMMGITQKEAPANSGLQAIEFSESELEKARDTGQGVFVYFTADWCITCKVNERLALTTDETIKAFSSNNIIVMKADWTNRNDSIAAVLASYGRAGVPMYLYFKPNAPEAILLPEIITTGLILETVED